MPIPGLSLFGFWPEGRAVEYLRSACVTIEKSDASLTAAWAEARQRIGGPIDRAGEPEISDLPASCADHAAAVRASPLFGQFQHDFGECRLALVEIDPLISVQTQIATDTGAPGEPASVQAMVERCLPLAPTQVQAKPERDRSGHGLVIRHSDFNLAPLGAGLAMVNGALVVGPMLGLQAPFVHVIRVDGVSYLRNGYHRVCAARRSGITHVPCLLFDGHRSQIGVPGFEQEGLDLPYPPTCGHFAPERAQPVQLRRITNVVTVTWTQYLLAEDEGD